MTDDPDPFDIHEPSPERIEREVIGALMIAPHRQPEVAYLQPAHFAADTPRRRIFEALRAQEDYATNPLMLFPNDTPARVEMVVCSSTPTSSAHLTHFARMLAGQETLASLANAAEVTREDAAEYEPYKAHEAVAAARERIDDIEVPSVSTGHDVHAPHPNDGDGTLATGFADLDAPTGGGLPRGGLTVIAADTSVGKTLLATSIAARVARDNPVLFFSLEMTRRELAHRFPRDVRVTVVDDVTDLGDIVSMATGLIRQKGYPLVVVDYVQLCEVRNAKDMNREQVVAGISRELKLLAARTKVAVLTMSQVNEAGQVRESRAIKQNANMLLHLKAETNDDGVPIGPERTAYIDKQRAGEAGGRIPLVLRTDPYLHFAARAPVGVPMVDVVPPGFGERRDLD